MSLFETEYEVKISFEDIDFMGIVWHGNYIRYMEQARCDLLAKLGYNYFDMKNDGYLYPVAKMETKYIKPATFEDILVIKTSIISIEPAFEINYVIYNKKTNEKLFKAHTMQIAVDEKTKQSIYIPPKKLSDAIKGKML